MEPDLKDNPISFESISLNTNRTEPGPIDFGRLNKRFLLKNPKLEQLQLI
uniref:Uncharacterized protein n=1 Tax=Lepeophtheirus salmonis TaxID=72036 RepID=A0A0K2UKN0_LEPSM